MTRRAGARRHSHRRGDERDPRRVRTLRLATRAGRPSPARPRGQSQEGQAPHARTRSPATHASAICGDDGQRPRPSDLPQSGQGHDHQRRQSALGRRHHLRRCRAGLRLRRGDSRRLVAPRRRLRHQPIHRCPADARRSERRNRGPQSRRPAAFITRIAGRNMPRKPIGRPSTASASSARWAGAAIPTTTPKRRAS